MQHPKYLFMFHYEVITFRKKSWFIRIKQLSSCNSIHIGSSKVLA